MAEQGSGGAFEISQRMTAMLGWGATTDFNEDWTWNQAAETYALDADMAAKLRKNNPEVILLPCPKEYCMRPSISPDVDASKLPCFWEVRDVTSAWQAFGNLLRRMLEASGRGIWNADSDVLDKLNGMYRDLDDQLEGV